MSLPASQRIERWISDLESALDSAAQLSSRGEQSFHADPALPLAFEALSNRVGELSKRLVAADPVRFNAPIWSQAAKNRDFVVHHYDRIDNQALWLTITVSFPQLRQILHEIQHGN